jgi:hypothetical protein
MRDMTTTHVGEQLSAPLGSVTAGRLVFSRGAARLRIDVDASMDDLYRARFEGKVPRFDVEGGTVTVTYRLGFRPPRGEIMLSGRIPWTIEGHMGMSDVSADLERGRLLDLNIGGGSSKMELRLPRPDGAVRIRIGGGASRMDVIRPADVPVSVRVGSGVSHLTVDDVAIDGAAGKTQWRSPGYEAASDRYDIRIGAGASAITVQT